MYYDPHSPTENETNLKHLMNVGFDKYFHKLINSATRKPIKSMFVLSIANGLGCVCGDKIKKKSFQVGICTAHQIFWQNHRNLFKCLLIKYVHAPSILSAEWCQFNCLILANLSQNQKLWKILIDHKKNQGEVNSIIEKPDKSECRPIHFKFWFTIQKMTTLVCRASWQLITPSDELMVTWLWCPVKSNHATRR